MLGAAEPSKLHRCFLRYQPEGYSRNHRRFFETSYAAMGSSEALRLRTSGGVAAFFSLDRVLNGTPSARKEWDGAIPRTSCP
jgi:hypothetical protein